MSPDTDTALRDASVLVVDDIPENINILGEILEADGYQVFAATSGELALQIAAKTPLDLVLLDVAMPGLDGLETCRRLKAVDGCADVPVLFVTAKTETEDVIAGFAAGGADYISKPVRREEVRARVRTQLQNRRYLQAQREQAEHYRGIVTNMAEGLLILDAEGCIQSANPRCAHLLGYPGDELVGRRLDSLLGEAEASPYLEYLSAQAGQDPLQAPVPHGPSEVAMRQRDGRPLALDFTVSPLFLSRPLFIGLLHDISGHKESEHELLRMAHMDPLTNLANRRRFDAFLQQEWHRALRNRQPLSLLMLDVDHFKLYNDALGHPAGDRCLQQVAAAVQACAQRPTDLAARYGGEEFVTLFAETPADKAQLLAEALRARIEALHLPHPASRTACWVTVSVGLATLTPAPESSPEALLAAADQALYRAKADGRNRVRVAD